MNNLSTPSRNDISSQIGALELDDHPAGWGDHVMEAFAFGDMQTRMAVAACLPLTVRCISDGALEEAGMSMGDTQRPTSPRPYGRCISDGALEEAGMSMGDTQRPTSPRPYGRCISDGALEAAAGNPAMGPTQSNCPPPTILIPNCHR